LQVGCGIKLIDIELLHHVVARVRPQDGGCGRVGHRGSRGKDHEFLLCRSGSRMNGSVFDHKLLLLWLLLLGLGRSHLEMWLKLGAVAVAVANTVVTVSGVGCGGLVLALDLMLLKYLLGLDVVGNLVDPRESGSTACLLLLSLLHGCGSHNGLDTRDIDTTEGCTVSAASALEDDALHALANRWKSLQEEWVGADILLWTL